MPQSPTSYGMLGILPPELRDNIYSLLLTHNFYRPITSNRDPYFITSGSHQCEPLTILKLSSPIRQEALACMRKCTTFTYESAIERKVNANIRSFYDPIATRHTININFEIPVKICCQNISGDHGEILQRFLSSEPLSGPPTLDTGLNTRGSEAEINLAIHGPMNHAKEDQDVINIIFREALHTQKMVEFMAFHLARTDANGCPVPDRDQRQLNASQVEEVVRQRQDWLKQFHLEWNCKLERRSHVEVEAGYRRYKGNLKVRGVRHVPSLSWPWLF
ncbi:uncharacterized protein KY384_000031 [Bacidia gigantensis]|uniref:uncharacterized protein n=1 Tax=Bacidia gigantensis TaxID=2732470 RepID=UPI001D0547A4|nr:uncharacterized protein KY384_000031 [Bacidia gigantensis]KAG8526438.1 hypothetical protein KY384_000031 [Bacidia gigantensis]